SATPRPSSWWRPWSRRTRHWSACRRSRATTWRSAGRWSRGCRRPAWPASRSWWATRSPRPTNRRWSRWASAPSSASARPCGRSSPGSATSSPTEPVPTGPPPTLLPFNFRWGAVNERQFEPTARPHPSGVQLPLGSGNWALRGQAGSASSDSCGGLSLPFDVAAHEQQTESVVVEVPESVGDALDLLDQQVDGLGRAVTGAGGVVGEDLGAPPGHGLGQPVQLGHP